jgi:hypothetical protein
MSNAMTPDDFELMAALSAAAGHLETGRKPKVRLCGTCAYWSGAILAGVFGHACRSCLETGVPRFDDDRGCPEHHVAI